MKPTKRHYGFTLIEALVIVAIIGLLISMLLPAIQKVRLFSSKLEIDLKLRSISHAMLQYAAERHGNLPGIALATQNSWGDKYPLWEYLRYLSNLPVQRDMQGYPIQEVYTSPLDYSVSEFLKTSKPSTLLYGPSSFSTNMLIHLGFPKLGSSIPDGLSNTIYAGEHFAITAASRSRINTYGFSNLDWRYNSSAVIQQVGHRYAGFCNEATFDVMPVTSGSPPNSMPSIPNTTFQHRTDWQSALDTVLHSTMPRGLEVAFCDGSVRTMGSNIDPKVYWGLITPNGSERVDRFNDE